MVHLLNWNAYSTVFSLLLQIRLVISFEGMMWMTCVAASKVSAVPFDVNWVRELVNKFMDENILAKSRVICHTSAKMYD